MNENDINWQELWSRASARFTLGPHSLHGPDHWQRVERNALEIPAHSAANVVIVRLFAVPHDTHRMNENHDPEHGARAAAWARQLRGEQFQIADDALETLCDACVWHDKGRGSADATIGASWDGDRLDLPRVGITPIPRLTSTAHGKALAGARARK